MVRKRVIAEPRPWKCPICNYQRSTARRLAQHILMKWDEAHINCRFERYTLLPHRPEDMLAVQRMIPEILKHLPGLERRP